MRNLRLRSPVNGRSMKIEIVLTTTEAGLVMEKVVAQDKVTDQTDIKYFVTWYAARLLKGGFNLHLDDDNIFGWVAVDTRGDKLTIRVVPTQLTVCQGILTTMKQFTREAMAETVKSNSRSEAQEAFLRHFYSQTYPNPKGNGRVYADHVLIEACPFDGGIHVSEVRALTGFRTGSGKAAMEFLTSLADIFGVTLSINAERIGKEGMPSAQLRKWFYQYGFNGTEYMLRDPQKITKKAIYLSEHNDAPSWTE